jgi:hypothetical protein
MIPKANSLYCFPLKTTGITYRSFFSTSKHSNRIYLDPI